MPNARILVVEDDPKAAKLIELRVTSAGYQVCGVLDSGEEAVKQVRALAPDAVLMDIVLAGPMDGIEAAEKIRASCDLPVIYLTVHPEEDIFRRARNTAPYAYLLKPCSQRELELAIETALYRHRLEKSLRQELELQLQERTGQLVTMRRHLDLILEHLDDAFFALDRDLRYTYANHKAAQALGRNRAELLGKSIREEFPENLGAKFRDAFERALSEKKQVSAEECYPQWGGWHEIRIYAGEEGVCIFLHDIEARKALEGQAKRHVTMLDALYHGAHALAESMEMPEIALTTARLCVEVLGVRLAWLGRAEPDGSVGMLAHFPSDSTYAANIRVRWDDTPAGQGPTGRALRSGTPEITADILDDPRYSPWREAALAEGFRSSAAFPLGSRGQPFGTLNLYSGEAGFFGAERLELFQAIADQAAAALVNSRLYEAAQEYAATLERRVAGRTAQFEAANQELEAFTYTVSHDLRAPLRTMEGFAAALLEDFGERLDEKGREYALRVAKAAAHMDALIKDLLEYSRLGRAVLALQPLELEQCVTEALAQLEAEVAASGARITVTQPLPKVRAHRPTVMQILVNLLGNAMKFVAPGTVPEVTVRAETNGRFVRLRVEDNGIGIPPQHRERIFRVFERLHGIEAYPGTGIGLAIVKKGAERMGGSAGVESGPGKGSRFWVDLPGGQEGAPQ